MKPKLRFTTLFSHPFKEKFEDIKSTTAILDSCLVKGNSKYTALSWHSSGGGALAILDINKPSRLPHNFPMIRGHSGVVMDFDFYPFNDDIIITASEDASLRLWNIPPQLTEDLTQHTAKLVGHAKKVNLVQFHPSAESVVASASFDYSVRVWNVETQSALCQIKGAQESFMSLEWNPNGSQILTSCRDKNVRIADPRSGAWEQEFRGHEGPKTQKSVWLGHGYVATAGFSKNFGREMFLWNVSNLKEPVQTLTIDQAAGTLYPFYDEDCHVLYLAGKGDGNIRYYEFADGQLYNLTQHTSTVPQKGIGFLPKRCVDVTQNELMRAIKLTTNTLEFVSFNAMRKSESFQEDLYPPCVSGEPAIKAEEWASGKNAEPKRRSMDPEASGNVKTGGAAAINVTGAPVTQTKTTAAPVQHVSAQSHVDPALQQRVSALEGELNAVRQEVEELSIARNELTQQNETIRSELWAKQQENEDLRAQLAYMREELQRREAEREAQAYREAQHAQETYQTQQETYGEGQNQEVYGESGAPQETYQEQGYQEIEQNPEIQGEANYQAQQHHEDYGQHGNQTEQVYNQEHTENQDLEGEY